MALLASGQSSTITGTLAGQVVMEGFMHWRIRPWVRRLITRMLAILPAVFIIGVRGDGSVKDLLTLSQVVLALQIAVRDVSAAALHQFREANGKMEERLVSVNCRLDQRYSHYRDGYLRLAGFAENCMAGDCRRMSAQSKRTLCMKRFCVTLDSTRTDRAMIEHVKQLAKLAHSRVVLLHVADGWAARTYGRGRSQSARFPKTRHTCKK